MTRNPFTVTGVTNVLSARNLLREKEGTRFSRISCEYGRCGWVAAEAGGGRWPPDDGV